MNDNLGGSTCDKDETIIYIIILSNTEPNSWNTENSQTVVIPVYHKCLARHWSPTSCHS